TNIMVPDGKTVVIGGLMREDLKSSGNQVPLFGNLPFVGAAFRNRTETIQRQEIIVLITPRIVTDGEMCAEGEQAACEFHRRQNVYAEKMSPLGKRSLARSYARKAENSMLAGDLHAALRQAEMAVHLDPTSRDAIAIRAEIWQRLQASGMPVPLAPMSEEILLEDDAATAGTETP
ncbi:MAG: hypothetical protein D6741_08390, partial [Planctomycetota bacterium]